MNYQAFQSSLFAPQDNWTNLLEVIQSDYPGYQYLSGQGNYGINDNLQPILDYLRQDANAIRPIPTARIQSTFFTGNIDDQPASSAGPSNATAAVNDQDDGVIDLTFDDDLPVSRDTVIIDLATTPPPTLAADNQNDIEMLDQNLRSPNSTTGAPKVGQGENGENVKHLEPILDYLRRDAPSKPSADSSTSCLSLLCPVCWDGFDLVKTEGRQLLATKCGHIFCSSCIDDIIRKHKCCPTCRKPVKRVSLRVIYL